jgi:hypothetical protein
MTALLLPNIDLEYSLGAGLKPLKPTHQRALRQRWAHILRLVGAPTDEALLDAASEPLSPHQRLIPWGVDAQVHQIAPHQRWPATQIVALVNSKATSHAIERSLGCALPHSALIRSLDEARAAASSCPHRWVLKHPFGVSGRERALGQAHQIDPNALRWTQRQLDAGATLVFEPWLDEIQETSLHYFITSDGAIELLGVARLLCDTTGTLRGHQVDDDLGEPEWEPTTREAVAQIAALGYHGPVSLDAMTGHLGAHHIIRPLTEINARHTFGRLAIELYALCRDALKIRGVRWEHLREREPPAHDLPPLLSSPAAGRYRLPEWLDDGARSVVTIW